MSSAVPKERVHTFFVVKQPGQPDRVIVWDTQDVSVGRAPENDVTLEHGELSRRHAVFSHLENACVVRNLSTSNGTFVNGREVETHTLTSRDVVQMADLEFHFYQVTQNPVTLGAKIVYASQLKDFDPAGTGSASPDATVLGLAGSVGDDDEFEVRPASEFAYDLHGIEDLGKGPAPRNLDLELGEPAVEELELPAKDQAWSLDDELPAAPPERLSLHLEIEGLEGELRDKLELLLGKTLELPALRIRVKGDDRA